MVEGEITSGIWETTTNTTTEFSVADSIFYYNMWMRFEDGVFRKLRRAINFSLKFLWKVSQNFEIFSKISVISGRTPIDHVDFWCFEIWFCFSFEILICCNHGFVDISLGCFRELFWKLISSRHLWIKFCFRTNKNSRIYIKNGFKSCFLWYDWNCWVWMRLWGDLDLQESCWLKNTSFSEKSF